MAGIILKNVSKVYPGNVTAVSNFSIDIADKEFITIVGPTGSGKTTVLRMIAGLEEITSGKLYIGDKLCNDVEPKDRDISMVFQNNALYPHMTVFDNMAFGLKLRNTPKEEIKQRVHEAAAILKIEHLLDRKPGALSEGQQQRVSFGRAIVREPKVLLMDETLSNLNSKLKIQIRSIITKLYQKLNTVFIYITQDQNEALKISTRVVVMKEGSIQQIDQPQKLYNEPENVFVAGFIGTPGMNFIDAVVKKDADRVYLAFGEYQLEIPSSKANVLIKEGYVNKEVIMGIRPGDIHEINTHIENRFGNELRAQLEEGVEESESGTLLSLIINDVKLTAQIAPHSMVNEGDEMKVAFDMSVVHIFDKKTEKAIVH